MYDKDGDGKFEDVSWDTKRDGDKDNIADWLEVTKVFTEAGFTNGFISNGKKWDLPHFQKTFGLTWQQMKTKIDVGEYTEEIQNGKKIKYIKI
jgi:peptidoglycan L-alanyl-D-glutamate endopeptidase CwlK